MQAPWVLPQKPLRQRSDECGGGKRMEAGFKESAAKQDLRIGRIGKQYRPQALLHVKQPVRPPRLSPL